MSCLGSATWEGRVVIGRCSAVTGILKGQIDGGFALQILSFIRRLEKAN